MKCKIKLFTPISANRSQLTVEVEGNISETYEKLKDHDCEMKLMKFSEKRSLSANAYYWVLVGKLATVLQRTNNAVHNMMLRRYGVPERYDGNLIVVYIPDSDAAEEQAIEQETYHIKPTSSTKIGKDNEIYRAYILLKGSSQYDSDEMKHLINGIVDECKQCGIETMTPEELARLNYER